jgi:hypothetical protein
MCGILVVMVMNLVTLKIALIASRSEYCDGFKKTKEI